MNTKIVDTIDYALIAFGATWSLDNIESVLGIVVLAIQVIWLLAKFIVKLITICKTSNIENIGDNLDSLDKDLEEITDKLTPKEGEVHESSKE